jgi:hypothetical protein
MKLNTYQINTTAWDEEDFLLITSLTEEQITKVIEPIVNDEREKEIQYDNDMLVNALQTKYPKAVISYIHPSSIELIQI